MRTIILFLFLCIVRVHAQDDRSNHNPAAFQDQPCAAAHHISDDFSSRSTGDAYLRTASSDITAISEIGDDTAVTFVAGNAITLKSGFFAAPGSEFVSYIGDCKTVASKPANDGATQKNRLTTAPNPAANRISIALEQGSISRIILVAMDGKTVFDEKTSSAGVYNLEVGQYPKGIYLLTVETNTGNRLTEKIIVQ